jgi:NAD(P)-dependent dehydrogenase (short-subunit alcohol dehydrogenase family)
MTKRFDLSDRVAIVTGGSRGIGRALALGLAENGAAIVVNYQVTASRADAVVGEIEAMGGRALAVQADVSSEADAARLVEETVAAFGKVDILVNNAGIIRPGPIDDFTLADWRSTMAVNLDGVFLMCRAAGAHMIRQRRGCIVTIGSMSGLIVNWPFRHTA